MWWKRKQSAAADVATASPDTASSAPVNSRWLAVIALQAALIIALSGALVYFARDEFKAVVQREEEEIETPSRVGAKDGAAMITLSASEQKANGIESRPLQAFSAASTAARLQGSVADLGALFETRMKYSAELDEARVVRAQLARSEAEYRRADALFRDDRSVAERVVQEARAAWRADEAKLAAANRRAQELSALLRQEWGDALAQAALQSNSEMFGKFVQKREVIVLVASNTAQPPPQLQVAPLAAPHDWQPATLVGAAPRADAQFSGATFFYRTPAGPLRVGMQIVARHGEATQRQGVIVPREALLWHSGKSWVYVKQAPNAFVRREAVMSESLDDGWFVQNGVTVGQEVVVSGAQLLLSEEFRYQIRNENDD